VVNDIKIVILVSFIHYPLMSRTESYAFYNKFVILFSGCCYATEYPVLQEFTVDIGGNVTLPCTDSSTVLPLADPHFVIWVREGRDDGFNRRRIEPDGALTLTALERDDAGIYACTVEGEYESSDGAEGIRSRVKVEVRSESVLHLLVLHEFLHRFGEQCTQR
jgi:hypothetical protein